MLGILRHQDNDACHTLSSMGIELKEMKTALDQALFQEKPLSLNDSDRIRPSKAANALVNAAGYEALKLKTKEIRAIHLLLAIAAWEDCKSHEYLQSKGINKEAILSQLRSIGKLRESKKIQTPHPQEAVRALGEQLHNLMGSVESKTNYPS